MTRIAALDPARARLVNTLAKIRGDFLDGLFPLVNELDYQKEALRSPANVPSAIESIQKIAHKLSGLAGSVGFSEMGACAAEIDIATSRLRQRTVRQADLDELDGQVDKLLDHMEAALDEAL